MTMVIRNWKKFQHFKDRRPPWIKLHREMLENRDMVSLSDKAFRVLIGLWLLASEDPNGNGELPNPEDIAFRLRISKSCVDKALGELVSFVHQDDITVISEGYQVVPPEVEVETEKEKRQKRDNLFEIWWDKYGKKVGLDKAKGKWLLLTDGERQSCLDHVDAYVGSTPEKQYRKNPLTYLNGKHWQDEVVKDSGKQAKGVDGAQHCTKCGRRWSRSDAGNGFDCKCGGRFE